MALLFTIVYLCGFILITAIRLDELICLSLNELGDFLAGAFGPLALAWLVFGYFQQGDELKQGTQALHMQAKELNASVQQQVQMVEAQKLALENHERSLEPIIYIEYKGRANHPDGDFDSFLLSNKGEYCDMVNLSYVRISGEVVDIDFEPLHKGGEKGFMLEADYGFETMLTVRYRKVSGKNGSQRFESFCEFDQSDRHVRVRKLPL